MFSTREELIAERNRICEQLIAEGWDYDDARSATMTVAHVEEQGDSFHPALSEYRAAASKFLNAQTDDRDEIEKAIKRASALIDAQCDEMNDGTGARF